MQRCFWCFCNPCILRTVNQHIGEGDMRFLERFLIKFTMFLCNVLDVTPNHLETLRQKKRRPLRLDERFDHFEA